MPITSADIPKALLTTMRTEFLKCLDDYPGPQDWRKFTMEVPSTTDTETYGWLGQIPVMREFVGERLVHDMTESGTTLKNKTWETTISVKRSAIEDDKIGMIRMKVQGMAAAYQEWLNQQAFECLATGSYTLALGNLYGNAFDGIEMFGTHTLGTATIDNLTIGGGALAAATLKLAWGIMKTWKGDQGRYLNVTPTLLVVPPVLEQTAYELCYPADAATSGQWLKGRCEPIVSPYMSSDHPIHPIGTEGNNSCWYLIDGSKPFKPIIYQRRTELEFTELTANSDIGFLRDEWLFGVRVRSAFGYGAYWLADMEAVA